MTWNADKFFDRALDDVKFEIDLITLCSAAPTTYTQAFTTYKLADAAVTNTDFAAVADGSPSGRRITLYPVGESASVSTGGTGTHWALVDSINSILYFVGECASIVVVATDPIMFSDITITCLDPVEAV